MPSSDLSLSSVNQLSQQSSKLKLTSVNQLSQHSEIEIKKLNKT